MGITDPFQHVLIHFRFQKFVSFSINSICCLQHLFFQGMPFGLNLGPLIFTTVISPALKLLNSLQISASVYINDCLLWARDPLSQVQTNSALNILESLGFKINLPKSQLTPATSITHLGFLWHGLYHTMRPADNHITKTFNFVTQFLKKRTCLRRDFQKVLGLLNFAVSHPLAGQTNSTCG